MKHLENLELGGTNVTAEGVEEFRQASPNCTVRFWVPGMDITDDGIHELQQASPSGKISQ